MKNNNEIDLLPDQSLGEKLIKKGFWLYLFSFLVAPAGYIIKVLISNSVSVADVGVLYSVVGLVGLLSVYNDLGLTESLQYFIPRYWIKKQYNYIKTSIYMSLAVQIFTGIIIASILWFWAPWLATHYFHSPSAEIILRYFCFYFLGINLFQILQSIFYAFQNTLAHQLVEFIKMWSIVGFTLFFFLSGRADIEWYSLNWILGLAVGIVIGLVIFFSKYKKKLFQGKLVFEKPMIKEYMKYAFWCFLGLNAIHIFGQVIQQLVIVILGPEPAGYYTNFISLFGMSSVIVGPIIGLIFPMVSELITKKDNSKLKLLFSFFYTYFFVFSFLLAVFMIVLGPEIALILFGQKFLLSGQMLSWGAMFTIATIFVGFNFSVLAGMGKIKERVKILFISILLVTILSIVGMYSIGILGSVLALGVSYTLLFILSLRLIHKEIPFGVEWKFIVKNIIIGIGLGGILWWLKINTFVIDDLMRMHNLWKLMIFGLGFFVVFGILNYKKILLLKGEMKKLKIKD